MHPIKAIFLCLSLLTLSLLTACGSPSGNTSRANISFSERFLNFGETLSELSFSLSNSGNATAQWKAISFFEAKTNPATLPDTFELFVEPLEGALIAGASEDITISFERSSLAFQGFNTQSAIQTPALQSGSYELILVFDIDGQEEDLSILFEVESRSSPQDLVANNDSYSVNQGATLTVDVANGILANDTGPAGATLLVTSLEQDVSHGTLDLRAGGQFTYTHDGSSKTGDSFSYIMTDGQNNSNTATVTILVSPAPDPAPGPAGDYSIALEFLGTGFSPGRQAVFQEAANRWMKVITGDLADLTIAPGEIPADGACSFAHPALEGTIDDLLILASITPIDGPGGTLGQAGPSFTRTSDGLTVIGCMEFDSDDIADMEAEGSFPGVILHEMGHVLGIGTSWKAFDLIRSEPDCDSSTSFTSLPQFTGSKARIEYAILGGSGNIPVEDEHGGGTRCGHWDEDVFDTELMTGFAEGPNPIPMSRMTIASLEDMGYIVDYSTAEAYSIPTCSPNCDVPALRTRAPGSSSHWEVILLPIGSLSADGKVERLR